MNNAVAFCATLSMGEELDPFYRLPTEAEWEFACRAGTTTRFWSGNRDSELLTAGWSRDSSGGRTRAVGELGPNPFGLSDMHGNAWEWMQDTWDPEYYESFSENAGVDPIGPQRPSPLVIRGGDWNTDPSFSRSSSRQGIPAIRQYVGFRVALPVDAMRHAAQTDSTN